ncbi:MAG TPA: FtsX-like permease family protein [Coleofasciculaceae cyanobacterium]
MASIARKNLFEDLPRFLVAQAGIMFAVSLVTIQTGLQAGFARSSSLLIDRSRADVWVTSKNMEHLGLTLPVPYKRVTEASEVEGVERAEGAIIQGGVWHQEQTDQISSITIVGAPPEGLLFSPDSLIQGRFSDLKEPYTFITDKTNLESLNIKQIGELGKIDSIRSNLVGLTQGTQSIVFGNIVFTSLESANAFVNTGVTDRRLVRDDNSTPTPAPRAIASTDPITFVLIKAEPGENLDALKKRLEDALPNTRAYTREEMARMTQLYWQERSGIGFILGLGAVVGVIVGVVVVGQILYASVSDRIKEFGTLKAMGASDLFIYNAIVEQGLWMAILGYLPGMALCLGVAAWTAQTQGIAILITPASAIAVLGITVIMCVGSAIFAIQKVTRVDPAIVFKS